MKYVNSVSVSPKTLALKVGDWFYDVEVEVCPEDADLREVRWCSDNPDVASVNEITGYICANAVGTATIYATAADGSDCSDYITVTVSNTIPVTSVTLSKTQLVIEKGHTSTLSATVKPNNATNKNVEWTSSNNSVATVSDGVVTARAYGNATITATATDGSGKSASCSVSVTNTVLVTEISVSPETKLMYVDDSCYLHATVLPNNATNQDYTWHSSSPNVATVNSDGLVYAKSEGGAIIYATAQDGSGVSGTCHVAVTAATVDSITISPKQKTLSPGETTLLIATVCPTNAIYDGITWTSNRPKVATVGAAGLVTAKSAGTATITAITANGTKYDTCTIIVDPREKATVKQDGHSFYVELPSSKIWRFIGLDISNRSEYYPASQIPALDMEDYDELITEEKRYVDNKTSTFTVEEIAYLYRFDPLGIEYYVREEAWKGKDPTTNEVLYFKDEIYEAIFGDTDRITGRFYFKIIDGHVCYMPLDGKDRWEFLSNAEILFGAHNIFDWENFWQSIIETGFEATLQAIAILVPEARTIVEITQALYYSRSIAGTLEEGASDFLNEYANDVTYNTFEKYFGWVGVAFTIFEGLVDATFGSFVLNNLNDMKIYSKIKEQNYRTVFDNNRAQLSIEEIISKCSNN